MAFIIILTSYFLAYAYCTIYYDRKKVNSLFVLVPDILWFPRQDAHISGEKF
jgi:tryptophan-rich sensory protein